MKISVVVPNHGRDISPLIDSLETSRVAPDEVFVVDLGLERSEQRNLGIERAINKHGKTDHAILWLDSDQAVSPTLIGEAKNMFRYGYSCLYVPEVITDKTLFGRIRNFERQLVIGTAVDVPRFVRAEVIPRFDTEQHGTEDADFGNRIPGVRGTTTSVLSHNDFVRPGEYLRKKAYYAKSLERFRERNPTDPVLNLGYRVWTVYTEKDKWRELIKHPILTLGLISLLAARGVIYANFRRHCNVSNGPLARANN